MLLQRGERQVNRTIQGILHSFGTLLERASYCQLTVSDITAQADIGRSTFYRHFSSKLEVLVLMHKGLFGQMLQGYQTADDWLQDSAPASLGDFIHRFSRSDKLRRQLKYTLGADGDQAERQIARQMSAQLISRLDENFKQSAFVLPLANLAAAIEANIRAQLTMVTLHNGENRAASLAQQIHTLNKGLILAALAK